MQYNNAFQEYLWQKAAPAFCWLTGTYFDPRFVRQDAYGNLIFRYDYGNRQSILGWEADHVVPKSHGGTDAPWNLRPLNWRANARRQDARPSLLDILSGMGYAA